MKGKVPNSKKAKGKVLVDLRQETICKDSTNRTLDQPNDYSIVNEGSPLQVYFEYAGRWIDCKVRI
jgi:hypothetical protein